jgi:hypothetical protein
MLSPRIFKRIDVASVPHGHTFYHQFFLEQFAYKMWNSTVPFSSGPVIIAEPSNEEYDYWSIAQRVEGTLRYYMKPSKLIVFERDIHNIAKSHILTRGWLNVSEESNNAVLLMERIDWPLDQKYMTSINNASWRPDEWDRLLAAQKLEQTIDTYGTIHGDVQIKYLQ